MRGLLAGIAVVAAVAWGDEAPEAPTFNRDIAPLVLANCAPCHRPGEAGPFSLLSYADVRSRAKLVAAVTGERYMPPGRPRKARESSRVSDGSPTPRSPSSATGWTRVRPRAIRPCARRRPPSPKGGSSESRTSC